MVKRVAARQYKAKKNKNTVLLWRPNSDGEDGAPNPQRLAMASKADVLGYGGSAGGGKTDLLLGLAATQHQRSVIFRRVFPSLRGVIERSREIFNPGGVEHGKDRFNESLHRWSLAGGRMVEFEAMQHEKDKGKQRGRPRDFYGIDEATEFSRSQVEFVMAWNRSTDPGQHCRTVMTFNPPIDEAGSWVVDYFLPWLAYLHPDTLTHPNPANPGELRWFATIDGKETECESGGPFEHGDEMIKPLSRTFIPAKLVDNPYLANTGYEAVLQSLPEPLRSQMLHGDFSASVEPDPWQIIPTPWVKAAQARWLEREKPEDVTLSGVGLDPARGGQDKATIAKRYATWFAEVTSFPGVMVPDGPTLAGLVVNDLGDEEPGYINIDIIGVGSSPYDSLRELYSGVVAVNAAARSDYTDRSGKLRMANLRAEYHWRLREALDPVHGDDLALPPGDEVVADLCAARYKLTAGGRIQVEDKERIKERIGRSPDVGEAIMLANLATPRGIFFG